MNSDRKFRCPSCGGLDIRRSLPRGPLDTVMVLFNRTPYRCRRCERRFYSTHARTEVEAPADTAMQEKAG